MKNKNIWEKLLVFILLVMCTAILVACGDKETGSDEAQDVETSDEVVYEDVEEKEDILEGWTKIKPTEEGLCIFDNTEDRSEDVEPGTIMKQLNAGDYQIIISKPILPEELQTAINETEYNYIEVSQIGSMVDSNLEEHMLILFYGKDQKIYAYNITLGEVNNSKPNYIWNNNFDWDHSNGWDNEFDSGAFAQGYSLIINEDNEYDTIYLRLNNDNFGINRPSELAAAIYRGAEMLE